MKKSFWLTFANSHIMGSKFHSRQKSCSNTERHDVDSTDSMLIQREVPDALALHVVKAKKVVFWHTFANREPGGTRQRVYTYY